MKKAANCGKGLRDVMLEIGPAKITVSDLWTVLDPSEVTPAETAKVKREVDDFSPGWLTDHVSTYIYRIPYIPLTMIR